MPEHRCADCNTKVLGQTALYCKICDDRHEKPYWRLPK